MVRCQLLQNKHIQRLYMTLMNYPLQQIFVDPLDSLHFYNAG